MKSFILHIGPAADYYFFRTKIIANHGTKDPHSFIYLLPVQRAVRRFKKELVHHTANGALIDPLVFTFDDLVHYCYHKNKARKKVISSDQRKILLSEILNAPGHQLAYFRSDRIVEENLIHRIEQMITELERFGYSANSLRDVPIGSLDKQNDFVHIMQALQVKLGDLLTDNALYTEQIISSLTAHSFKKIFPEVAQLYLNGYGIFTPPMIRFLQAVKNWLHIEVKIDYLPQNEVLFAHTQPAYDALAPLATKIVKHDLESDPLALNLFTPEGEKAKPKADLAVAICRDKESEVAFIASQIRQLQKKRGMPLDSIGVTFPDLESYSPVIRTIFKAYQIPFNLSTGFALSQSPLIQTIVRLLQTVVEGYKLEAILGLLNNPFLSHKHAVNISLLRRVIIRCGIKQFSGSWQNRIAAQGQLSEIKPEMLAAVESLVAKLRKFEGAKTASEFREAVYQTLKETGILSWYQRSTEHLDISEQENEFRAFNRFVKIFDQLIWFLGYLHQDKKLTVTGYLSYLKPVVRDAVYNLREWSNYGVQIMPRLEIQSAACRLLFVGGLVEGHFPRRSANMLFFNEQERKTLGLYGSEDLLNQDRFQFYQLLSGNVESIILTLPLHDDEQTQISSSFLAALEISPVIKTELQPEELPVNQLTAYFGRHLGYQPVKDLCRLVQPWAAAQNKTVLQQWLQGIDIYRKKKQYHAITSFEGDLTASMEAGKHLDACFKRRLFSVTALEQYAFCPMQFFLNRILRVEPPEEFEEDISAITRGRLIHRILHTFYTRLQEQGAAEQPWDHYQLLVGITQELLQQLDQQGLALLLEEELLLGFDQQQGLWQRFLEHEQEEIIRTGFKPFLFEWTFGTEESETGLFSVQGSKGVVHLTGRIDRIDVDAQGYGIVYDYKTGRAASATRIKEIYEGASLQLPVYLAAAAARITVPIRPAGAAWFQVKDGENCQRIYVIADGERAPKLMIQGDGRLPNKKYGDMTLDMLIARSLARATVLVEQLLQGRFRHTLLPNDPRCSQYCGYNMICRKDVQKLLHFEEAK